jgi:hypothetical protein
MLVGHLSPEWFVEQLEDNRGLTCDIDAIRQGYFITTDTQPLIYGIPVPGGQPVTYVYKRHVIRVIGQE